MSTHCLFRPHKYIVFLRTFEFSQNWFKNNRAKRRREQRRSIYLARRQLVLKQTQQIIKTSYYENNMQFQQPSTLLVYQTKQESLQTLYISPNNRRYDTHSHVGQAGGSEANFPPNTLISMATQVPCSPASSHVNICTHGHEQPAYGLTDVDNRMI